MAKCTAVLRSKDGKNILLTCDLDDSHSIVIRLHYDKTHEVDWIYNPYTPTAVPSTRNTPKPPRKFRNALVGASADTSQFEVVRG